MWDLEFTEVEPLDPRIAEDITADGVDSFTGLYSALAPFAAGEQESRENVWILFAENSLSHQALVAVLHHFVHVGQQKRANAEQRVFALHAAGLYFLLLEIPGSIINQVFHEVVFDKCLHTLTKCLPRDLRKRKKAQAQSSQSSARRNRKKGRPCRNDSPSVEEMLEEEEEEDDEDVYWSREGLLQVRNAIFLLLKNFLRLLTKLSLEEKPQCLQNCVQVFVEMTSFEPVLHEFDFSASMDVNKAEYIPEAACYGLYLLCSPLHGTQDKTLQCVFHRLLYVILMAESSEDSMHEVLPITPAVTSARNLAIKFISSLVDELKEAIYPTLRILLQHICAQVPDKADYRTCAAQALATLLDKLPCAEFASFIAWLYKFSLYEVPSRVFALDAALALLELPERNPGSSLSLEDQRFLKHKFLVQVMVFGRCSDIAPVVRSKALSSLDCCLEMKSAAVSESIQDLLQSSRVHTVLEASTGTASVTASAGAVSSHPLKTFPTSKTFELTDSSDTARPDGEEFMAILRERAGDEKIIVRKPAVRVLGSLLKHGHMPCTAENVGTLRDRCRDPAASVCKQALHSITELLLFQHSNVLVQKAWWNGVVPVVMGAENSVQEKALDCLDQILLQNIKPYNKSRSDDRQKLAWDLLSLSSESKELGRYLSRALTMWSSQKKLTSTFIQNVMSHLETEHSSAAWMLLAKVACSSPKLDYSKIIESWYSRQQNTSSDAVGHILCVIGHVAEHLPRSRCEGLRENIWSWLKEFQCPRVLISPAVQALQRLCRASVDVPKEAQELLNQVFGDLVSTCYSYISNIVLKEGGAEQLQEDLLVRHLFLLGEAAQMCPAKVEKYIFFLVQAILAPPVSQDQLSASKDSSQFRGSAMPTVVRAHAVMTLGKLCLQHDELARESIPVLVQELEVSQEMPVRINVVTALCDLCMLYTSLVDRYIPNISLCLRDPHPVIREHTLTLLTNLLQGEYVKLKNYLFFRFVCVLVDPNPDIASFAEYCLVHVLLMRNPVIFSQHFIECIFHFNSYEKHPKYNRFPQSERAKQLFSLKGKDNKEKRMRIYTFLLDHFTDEQRFNITTMISDNILACFVYKVLPLDLEGSELLSDTFAVLSCKEIKLSSMRSKPEEDIQPEEDEMSTASAVMQVAQKKLILQGQKKNLIENIIPTITSLKSLMEQKRTPALKDLMSCLREIMQDYRNEIKDFFAEDQQLVVELEYDMRKYEEQLAREKELEQEQLSAAHWEQSPSLERAASPGGQNNNNAQSPASGRPPTSGFIPSSGSSELAIPRAGALKQPQVGRRASLLSTVARLNAAFLAAEGAPVQRSKSVGRSSPSTSGSQQVSCQKSRREKVAVVGPAISTPEQPETIGDLTFGAGVSSISSIQTPSSGPEEDDDAEDRPKRIIYLPSPEEPPSPPRQWNVKSPARRRSSQQVPLQQSQCKTPLEAAK
ncbi:condensin-2 complex subunit D3 isoform X1 [Corvus cornix cornix]|uniref:condensin-2 complex subunit D3 isoform X1 n=1 Tax=Corvus cornix cornix TaxID=932674 RepID=UPI0009AF171B|nr:condensin-2 complex subunit D3 isoform X1 [Corvus cornix cornix]